MIARFGHHNGVTWNMGEENTNTTAERKAFMDYFKAMDPYDHPVVIHTIDGAANSTYSGLLGHDAMDGMSLQSDNPRGQIIQFGRRRLRPETVAQELGRGRTRRHWA